ncbi:MAG TPA: M48 family metalloprotease [Burkholderiales bacterium]|jgi:predicted Zn-dependent protease
MRTGALACIFAGLALAAGARAVDLDDLRKALEKPKQQPAPGEPAPGQPAKSKPDLSDLLGAVRGVSPEEEAAIGRQIAGNLLGAAPLVADAKLQAYVNRVGRWVALRSGRPDLKWTFGVIESADINAFAAPGGYVFVTRGLYARLQDEAQLAGVLAHEIGHVQQKHHLKLLQQQQLIGAGSSILSKKLKDKQSVQRLIGSGAEICARGLDKSAEFEADRIGVVLATRAGYDPYGLPAVLQDIGALSKDAGSVALLFKTHPHPDERLAQLSEAMGERFDGIQGARNLPERLHPVK